MPAGNGGEPPREGDRERETIPVRVRTHEVHDAQSHSGYGGDRRQEWIAPAQQQEDHNRLKECNGDQWITQAQKVDPEDAECGCVDDVQETWMDVLNVP